MQPSEIPMPSDDELRKRLDKAVASAILEDELMEIKKIKKNSLGNWLRKKFLLKNIRWSCCS
jgi:hypothetical protein